jgi:GNAT superfamily N-acetyltransferase
MADVRILSTADFFAAAQTLARGFDQEPAKLALVPDPLTRRAALELSARNRLYDAVRRGTAHAALIDEQPVAVAVWIPPGVAQVSLSGALHAAGDAISTLGTVRRALPHVASLLRRDVMRLARLVRGRKRAVARAARGQTWCLALLATLPEHRGKGLARALLERQLRRCDEDGAAAWLETTDPVNLPIYRRFGFREVAHFDGPDWLPGLWVMRREPGSS